jgi:hypothetical protein
MQDVQLFVVGLLLRAAVVPLVLQGFPRRGLRHRVARALEEPRIVSICDGCPAPGCFDRRVHVCVSINLHITHRKNRAQSQQCNVRGCFGRGVLVPWAVDGSSASLSRKMGR